MMVSFIASLFDAFGSRLVPDGSDFALQSRASGFALVDGHPNQYAPGKRPFHTLIPGFVLKDGQPWMSFGVLGGSLQPQMHVQARRSARGDHHRPVASRISAAHTRSFRHDQRHASSTRARELQSGYAATRASGFITRLVARVNAFAVAHTAECARIATMLN